MKFNFEGKVVLVTGAAQGIGKSIAEHFMEAGATVHLTDLDTEGLESVAAELQCAHHSCDLTDRSEAIRLVGNVVSMDGRLDILVLAAGGVCGYSLLDVEDITEENWSRVIRANLDTALWVSQAASVEMRKHGWGRIITIASTAGIRPSLTGLHAYTSAKHALVGLTKQLSASLARYGITVNSVAPGFILTSPATRKQWADFGEEGQKRYLENLHTRREGGAEDIANPTLFFASEEAGWITGQVLAADGGRS